MKRKLAFLVVLLGSIILVFVLLRIFARRAPGQGVLKVNASPESSIFLDNQHKAQSPFEDKVNEGEYIIKLVPDSSSETVASWQGKVRIAPNLLTYVNADLGPTDFTSAVDVLWLEKISSKDSEIAITSSPDGAIITVNGEARGASPTTLTNITPGDYTLSISSPGFLSRSIKIKTTSGYRLNMSMKLALNSEIPITPSPVASESAGITGTPSVTPRLSSTPTLRLTPTRSASSSSTLNDPPKPYIIIADTPTGFLRVRKEPQGAEVGQVQPGQKFTIVEEQNGWFKIKYDGTSEGWVSGQYVSKVQ